MLRDFFGEGLLQCTHTSLKINQENALTPMWLTGWFGGGKSLSYILVSWGTEVGSRWQRKIVLYPLVTTQSWEAQLSTKLCPSLSCCAMPCLERRKKQAQFVLIPTRLRQHTHPWFAILGGQESIEANRKLSGSKTTQDSAAVGPSGITFPHLQEEWSDCLV